MDKKRLVLPGEHVSSYEEAEPGENCYAENDEVYASAMGESVTEEGKAVVKSKGRTLETPRVGMDVYCVITKTSLNKAIAGCIPASEVEGRGRGLETEAVLPVTAIRRGYVTDIRHEVKIGDIIKARVQSIEKTGIELSIFPPEYGVVAVFCPRCRHGMDLKDEIFICSGCGWKERRKIAGHPSTATESSEPRPYRPREGFRPREGGRFREGGRDNRPRRPFRPRGGQEGA
jgi:exosome complex component CSL4